MYAPQSSIDPALAALLKTAQMVTPEQTPTVAAQVAQAAQQTMQPQGIMQGMQDAKQDYAAAAPSMMENMKQQQMQQMVKQAMQPQPAGIEGLPAPNMQSMADGGVVGYAGPDGSKVDSQVAQILQKAPAARSPEENDILRAAGVQLEQRQAGDKSGVMALDKYLSSPFIREAITGGAHKLSNEELRQRTDVGALTESIFRAFGGNQSDSTAQPQAMRPEDAFATPRMDQPQRPTTPPAPPMSPEAQALTRRQGPMGQPSPPAPDKRPPVPSAPAATGIATTLPAQPTLAGAMGEVEKLMPGTGTEPNRAALEELQRMRRTRPASGIGSLAALQEEARVMADLKSKEDASAQERGIMAWLAGRGGRGASAQSYMGYQQNEQQRQKLFAQENTIRAAKIDAINEANEARKVGDQEKYVEALNKLSELDRADKQVKAQLASNTMQTQAILRGQNMTAQTAAEDRASLERRAAADRAAQAALRNLPSVEQQMAERVMKDYMTKNPGTTLSDAWDFYRGAGKGLDQRASAADERNRIARQKLMESDPMYKLAKIQADRETDPAKKAEAQRKVQEFERKAGIVDVAASAPTQVPSGVTVTKVGP